VTTPFREPVSVDSASVPPPGCPAHGLSPNGLRRLYGAEAEADPRALYEKLRAEHGPVAPVLVNGDRPAWLVLGHRENLEVMRSPSRFSRDARRGFKVTPKDPLYPVMGWQPLCVFADGEEHARLRGAVKDSLALFNRRGLRSRIIRSANELVDRFAAAGAADLVDQFADHLPMLVMTQLFGMPDQYGPQLVDAAQDLMKGTKTAPASDKFVVKVLQELIDSKRQTPGHDFATWLLNHKADLTAEEVLQHLRLVLIAANETTVNLIANTLKMLLTDPRFRANLTGGHMTLPDALEQVLWDDPPMKAVAGRWATGDTEFGGQHLKAGDLLVLGLAAGNVDPAARPDLSTPVHGNRSHLAFSSGPHECPGEDIGRAIAETGIDALMMRLPDIRLAVPERDLEWDYAWLSHRLRALPVQFTPYRPKQSTEGPAAAPVNTTVTARPHQPMADQGSIPAPAPVPARAHAAAKPWWTSLFRWLRRR
jgi:cytochrome P450